MVSLSPSKTLVMYIKKNMYSINIKNDRKQTMPDYFCYDPFCHYLTDQQISMTSNIWKTVLEISMFEIVYKVSCGVVLMGSMKYEHL